MGDEKMQRCRDYVRALEAERCKIQVFQRELPLCLDLVSQAIERYRHQSSEMKGEGNLLNGLSECNSEQTTSDVPVMEEFIPIKRPSSSPCHSDDGEEHNSKNDSNLNCKNGKKSDWLRSVQLWNQTPDPPPQQGSPKKGAILEGKRNGAFHPFKKEKSCHDTAASPAQKPESGSAPPASASSSAESGGDGNKKEGKDGAQSQRKTRRCWSPELHRRFLQALKQLGGSHVATPKQIRELMKVDGLTNDEVKSHLQKYRLHTVRKPSSSIQNNSPVGVQTPQFVVVGGLWMPPEYTTMGASTTSDPAPPDGIYAPVATAPKPKSNPTNSDDEGGSPSHSPAASSTVTTTVQPSLV